MKTKEKEFALKLRIEQQLSLRQISDITGLAKSTLSILLRDYPLADDKIKELKIGKQLNGAMANKAKAELRKEGYRQDGAKLLHTHQGFRDLVFLYWGEGSKYKGNKSFSLPNADADMIRYVVKVLTDLGYFDKIVATAYCYEHSDLNEIKQYWDSVVGKETKSYVVKNSKVSSMQRVDKLPYGTLRLEIYSVELLTKVLGAIESIKGSIAQR